MKTTTHLVNKWHTALWLLLLLVIVPLNLQAQEKETIYILLEKGFENRTTERIGFRIPPQFMGAKNSRQDIFEHDPDTQYNHKVPYEAIKNKLIDKEKALKKYYAYLERRAEKDRKETRNEELGEVLYYF